jgi:hypothetical protein
LLGVTRTGRGGPGTRGISTRPFFSRPKDNEKSRARPNLLIVMGFGDCWPQPPRRRTKTGNARPVSLATCGECQLGAIWHRVTSALRRILSTVQERRSPTRRRHYSRGLTNRDADRGNAHDLRCRHAVHDLAGRCRACRLATKSSNARGDGLTFTLRYWWRSLRGLGARRLVRTVSL